MDRQGNGHLASTSLWSRDEGSFPITPRVAVSKSLSG